nr:unnamed protein product [Spirometra erinaceieuropaei]
MARHIFVLMFLGVICASDDFAITDATDIDCYSGDDESEAHQYYELCLKDKQQCTRIHYAKKDVSKGLDCRNACAVGPASKSKSISAFYCSSEEDAACNKYQITGRAGYAENFARHVKCVLACELVNSALEENSAHVRLCGCAAQTCTNFYPWDSTFSSFKDCWQDCSGWTNSDKTVLALAYEIRVFVTNATRRRTVACRVRLRRRTVSNVHNARRSARSPEAMETVTGGNSSSPTSANIMVLENDHSPMELFVGVCC